jgi:tRNA-dihydrouridine synthase B
MPGRFVRIFANRKANGYIGEKIPNQDGNDKTTVTPPFLYLAPMRGLTNALYRNLFAAHFKGIDAAIAPFIATVSAARVNPSLVKDIAPENNRGMPVIPQFIGNAPQDFILLARVAFDMGYDTVNWNLGCPYPMVAKKRRGSGLLAFPELVDRFLDAVIPRIPNQLSIKLRLGRKRADEIFELIAIFNRYPLRELIIHPRTGVQMYTGGVDLDTFEAILPLAAQPVSYNGDVFDLAGFTRLRHRFPTISRWMLGRGPLSNPFLPEMLKRGSEEVHRPVERFKRFHDALLGAYLAAFSGPSHVVSRMKGYWQYFSQSFRNGEAIFKRIKKAGSLGKYQAVVDRFFNEEAHWGPKIHF